MNSMIMNDRYYKQHGDDSVYCIGGDDDDDVDGHSTR